MPRYICLLLATVFTLPAPAFARDDDAQLWLQLNTNLPLTDHLRLTLEQIARASDGLNGVYQTELGGILGYKLAKNVELGFGYRWVGAHNGNTGANENRLRQHIVVTFGPLTTRLRIDERFNPRGSEIGFRIRPLIRYNQRLAADGTALFISHESFILPNSTDWGQRAGYERMRNIIGVTLPFGRRVMADVGYLNQYRPGRDGGIVRMDHAFNVQLTINLPGDAADVHD
jgi:hypothetical protein